MKFWTLGWLILCLMGLGLLTVLAPAEKTLGINARLAYLHGAWVWGALATLMAAALVGLAGLLNRRRTLHLWSRALGRAGLTLWVTYLPLSLWAMQANWNGLFLAEPRWRMAVIFALGGFVLQIGIALMKNPVWASAGNLAYFLILLLAIWITPNVMHPPSPMLHSNAWRIQVFFSAQVLLTLLLAWRVIRLWHGIERALGIV